MNYDYLIYDSVGLLTDQELQDYLMIDTRLYGKSYLNMLNVVATNIIEIKTKRLFIERNIEVKFFAKTIVLPFLPVIKMEQIIIDGTKHQVLPQDLETEQEVIIKYRSFHRPNETIKLAIIRQIETLLLDKSNKFLQLLL